MRKEIISDGQAISLMILFYLGTTITTGTSLQLGNDGWISIGLVMLEALPFLFICVRLLSAFPGKNLFDILELLLGKTLGKVVTLLYTIYTLQLGALILRIFSMFVHSVALPETPDFVTYIMMGALAAWLLRAGLEVMARTAKFMLIVIFIVLLAANIPSLGLLDIDYIKPVLGDGWAPVIKASFSSFAIPFSQSIILTGAVFLLEKKENIGRSYLKGYLAAGLVILLLGIRNIMMLGGDYGSLQYFPSYTAISRIRIGRFVQRVEGTVDIILLTTALFKTSINLFVATKGICSLFNHQDYRVFALPVAILAMVLADISFGSTMQFAYFTDRLYPFYALPFQVFIPVLLFLVYIIRKRTGRLPSIPVEEDES
jgi:spore germination protein KB